MLVLLAAIELLAVTFDTVVIFEATVLFASARVLLVTTGTSLGAYLRVMFVTFLIMVLFFERSSAGAASAGAASVVALLAVALVAFPPAGRGMQSASSVALVELVEFPEVAVPSVAGASAGAAPSPAAGVAPSVAFPTAAGALQNFLAFKLSFLTS